MLPTLAAKAPDRSAKLSKFRTEFSSSSLAFILTLFLYLFLNFWRRGSKRAVEALTNERCASSFL
jgi:hypothetical protein